MTGVFPMGGRLQKSSTLLITLCEGCCSQSDSVYLDYLAEVKQFLSLRNSKLLLLLFGASLVPQQVKNPPANARDMGWILGLEDPLEKEMVIHSRILAWKIPWTEEPIRRLMGCSQCGRKESGLSEQLKQQLLCSSLTSDG